MKMLSILMLVACMDISATGHSQSISLSFSNAPLDKVLLEIERQGKVRFIYSKAAMGISRPVTVSIYQQPLEKALSICFEGQPYTYSQDDKFIILKVTRPVTPLSATDPVPPLRGKVVNEQGEGLPGITVQIRGTNQRTATNSKGEFHFADLPGTAVLVVSGAEMDRQEIAVNDQPYLLITVNPRVGQLDETLVIGYGTTTRRTSTGNVHKVSKEEINRQPVANPLSTLAGKVPGLMVQSQNGLPGGNIKVLLRGQGSIAAGTDPLYVVDGVPFTSSPLNTISADLVNINGPVSPLNSINPADIESIEVLKDAEATAIYGSRGANGVILITTRKGGQGSTSFDLRMQQGFSKAARLPTYLGLSDYLAIRREAFINDAVAPTNSTAPDLLVWDTIRSTDWQDYILGGTAPLTEVNGTLSGGNAQTNFVLGLAHRGEGIILPGDQRYSRSGAHFKLHHQLPNGRLRIQFTASYSQSKSNLIKSVDAVTIAMLPPNYPLNNPDGSPNWTVLHPNAWLRQKALSDTRMLITNLQLRYQLLPGLTASLSTGLTRLDMDMLSTEPLSSVNPLFGGSNTAYFANSENSTFIAEPQLEYTRQLKQHRIRMMAGGAFQQNKGTGQSIQGKDYSSEEQLENLAAAGSIGYISTQFTQYRYISGFGRFSYEYARRLLFNASLRRDVSSRFGPGRQGGNFGAVSAGWVFSKESFLQDWNSWLSFGKLRGSYGISGNDQIPDYQYLPLYTTRNPYLGQPTLRTNRVGNPGYGWETNHKAEIGLELGFFSDKVLLNVAWYRQHSGNQLVSYPVPYISAPVGSYQANLPALIVNKGWEFSVQSTNIQRKDFTWTSSLNLTLPENKLARFPGMDVTSYANTYVIGEDLTAVRRLRFTGVDKSTGIATFADLNNDGVLRFPDDYVVAGKTSPDLFGGFENGFTYRRFRLDIMTQFVVKKAITRNLPLPGSLSNTLIATRERWQHPGDITTIQLSGNTPGTPAFQAKTDMQNSDQALLDASFFRFNNVSLSYDVPVPFLQRWKMSQARIFLLGQNLITLSRLNGDPETMTSSNTVPLLSSFVAGIQVTFK